LEEIFQPGPGRKLSVPVVKHIARQLHVLHALKFLHQECRIVIPTGQIFFAYVPSQALTDIKPDNILITLPNAEEAIRRHTTGALTSAMSDSFPQLCYRNLTIYGTQIDANNL
jgi:serine/threonine protein kinase